MFFCCCDELPPECYILTDDFNRTDSTNLGANWTETIGDPDIFSNAARFTTSNAVLLSTALQPNGERYVSIRANVAASASGDSARLIFNVTDSNDYFYLEFRWGVGGHLRLFRMIAGVSSQLDTVAASIAAGETITLTGCMQGDVFVGSYTHGATTETIDAFMPSGSQNEDEFGIGTGTVTGTVTFDGVTVTIANTDCTVCGATCTDCCTGIDPDALLVVDLGAGGLTDDGCTDCEDLVGEIGLTYGFLTFGGGVNACGWSTTIPATCPDAASCVNYWYIEAKLLKDSDGKCFWLVSVQYAVEGDPSCVQLNQNYTQYESPLAAADVDNCTATGPWTLDKSPGHADPFYRGIVAGWEDPGELWDDACGGSLPSTITLTLG